jgi:hypothetical protein
MIYTGVYRDGIVLLDGDVDLRNGARVEVLPTRRIGATKAKKRAAKGTRAKSSADPLLKFFGMSKDRADWKGRSSAEIARELRRRVSTRAKR